MHDLRRSMLHAVATAMSVGSKFDSDILDDDWLHELSSDKAWLEAAETVVDKIPKAKPEIEKLHGSDVRDRYVPLFTLTQDELDVFQEIADLIRVNLISKDSGSLVLAARLVEALKALLRSIGGVIIEATFSQKKKEGGRGWASLTSMDLTFGWIKVRWSTGNTAATIKLVRHSNVGCTNQSIVVTQRSGCVT